MINTEIQISIREGLLWQYLSKSWHCQKGGGFLSMPRFFGRFYTEVYRGQSKVINNPQKIINFPPKKSDGRLKTEAISTCFVEIRNTNQQLQHIVWECKTGMTTLILRRGALSGLRPQRPSLPGESSQPACLHDPPAALVPTSALRSVSDTRPFFFQLAILPVWKLFCQEVKHWSHLGWH